MLKVFDGVAAFEGSLYGSPTVLTIGNFDGVHRGHQELIGRAVARARKEGVPSVVFTFEPHPLMVLKPELKLKRLFDSIDRQERLAALGVDILVVEPFSRRFSQLSPEKFLTENVIRPFQPKALVVGYDFSFGANRSGSIDYLTRHAKSPAVPFDVEVVPPVTISIEGKDTIVSSTRIRQALSAGKAAEAAALLGRPYVVRGIVKKGAGRGRTIGIPTANIDPTVEAGIQPGVYAAYARLSGQTGAHAGRFAAMVNIGTNPTFTGDATTLHIEAHLPEYDGEKEGDLYGETMELHFVTRIRDERKFGSVAELVAQIRRDIAAGLEALKPDGGTI
ncbi:MAG: bifunctional riboflavin kinase/FAD synthetase [Bdellovibrionales bacterium]|jgi:riboflavin kinase/FMN adenylyltransferase|nr:bifunctional riboflavin kinase/FAD synthetase [Bdellovibrionales bacterium]